MKLIRKYKLLLVALMLLLVYSSVQAALNVPPVVRPPAERVTEGPGKWYEPEKSDEPERNYYCESCGEWRYLDYCVFCDNEDEYGYEYDDEDDWDDDEEESFEPPVPVSSLPLLDEKLCEAYALPGPRPNRVGTLTFEGMHGRTLYARVQGEVDMGVGHEYYYGGYYRTQADGYAVYDLKSGETTILPAIDEVYQAYEAVFGEITMPDDFTYYWCGRYVGEKLPDTYKGSPYYTLAELRPELVRRNILTGKLEVLLRRPAGTMGSSANFEKINDSEFIFAWSEMESNSALVTTIEKYNIKTNQTAVLLRERAVFPIGEPDVKGAMITHLDVDGGKLYVLAKSRKNWKYTGEIREYDANGRLLNTWKIDDIEKISTNEDGTTYVFAVKNKILTTDGGRYRLGKNGLEKASGDNGGIALPEYSVGGSFYYDYSYDVIWQLDNEAGKLKGLRLPLKYSLYNVFIDSGGNMVFIGRDDGGEKYEALWVSAKNLEAAFKAAP